MQHAVNPQPYAQPVTLRFKVHIGGASLYGLAQNLIHRVNGGLGAGLFAR